MTETNLVKSDSPREGVWRVVLDDPLRANALGPVLVGQLSSALHAAFAGNARVLMIDSSSERFCGGSDLRDVDQAGEADLRARFSEIGDLLEMVRSAPALTVAVVRGAAFGAGADLVASCDYRIGTPRARFAFPGSRFGIVLGTRHLAELVGRQHALELLVENKTLDAKEAYSCNLLSSLCDDERALASRIEDILSGSEGLDSSTLRALLRLIRHAPSEQDRRELLRSTARPGLAARIRGHAQRVRAQREARNAHKL
jgi:enoyl-CoA hydratase/carnithine racemase